MGRVNLRPVITVREDGSSELLLIYNGSHIRFAGEIAAKVRNQELARYFREENNAGTTRGLCTSS